MDTRIRKGMTARSTSGIALGRVISIGPDGFTVEKGIFFPQDHDLRNDCIHEVRGEEIYYRLADETMPKKENGWQKAELREGKELRMPLMEEQVLIQKESKETGSVRVHKNVVTEERKVTVPLKREEVIIEHVPAQRAGDSKSTHAFEDERYTIPVHEEEFQVVKQPVIREEVRVRCVTREEQRAASTSVRHEELEVEDETRQRRERETRETIEKKEV
jgi:uncharacterized protein (TIGR02271 family)